LGKYISTTSIVDATLHNLFDVVTGDENAALDVEYRCIFLLNNHATLTLLDPKVWISAQSAGVGADATIGLDPAVASPKGQAGAQAAEVVNEDTAPAGVTFSGPTTKATGLSLGNLVAGNCRALWIRRTATNSVAVNLDSVQISYEGDTEA
jgi:hypothetical protein